MRPVRAHDASAFMSLRRTKLVNSNAWIESNDGLYGIMLVSQAKGYNNVGSKMTHLNKKFASRSKWNEICMYFCESFVRI